MHETSIRLRFGLILEAYCRGCGAFLRNLLKQLEALDKLAKLSDKMKSDFMREVSMFSKLSPQEYDFSFYSNHNKIQIF